MMAAVLGKSTDTYWECGTKKPEIVQLVEFFMKMGAKIHGVGTGRLGKLKVLMNYILQI